MHDESHEKCFEAIVEVVDALPVGNKIKQQIKGILNERHWEMENVLDEMKKIGKTEKMKKIKQEEEEEAIEEEEEKMMKRACGQIFPAVS